MNLPELSIVADIVEHFQATNCCELDLYLLDRFFELFAIRNSEEQVFMRTESKNFACYVDQSIAYFI